jgi:hypothetical protein
VEIANRDRVIEYDGIRPNMEPSDAVGRMAAKLRTEGGKEGGEWPLVCLVHNITRELAVVYNGA